MASVFNTLYSVLKTAAIISLVEVFPTLPVTATTGILYKLLLYLARSPIALIVSSTLTIVLSLYLSSTSSMLSRIHTLAPLSKASL